MCSDTSMALSDGHSSLKQEQNDVVIGQYRINYIISLALGLMLYPYVDKY